MLIFTWIHCFASALTATRPSPAQQQHCIKVPRFHCDNQPCLYTSVTRFLVSLPAHSLSFSLSLPTSLSPFLSPVFPFFAHLYSDIISFVSSAPLSFLPQPLYIALSLTQHFSSSIPPTLSLFRHCSFTVSLFLSNYLSLFCILPLPPLSLSLSFFSFSLSLSLSLSLSRSFAFSLSLPSLSLYLSLFSPSLSVSLSLPLSPVFPFFTLNTLTYFR